MVPAPYVIPRSVATEAAKRALGRRLVGLIGPRSWAASDELVLRPCHRGLSFDGPARPGGTGIDRQPEDTAPAKSARIIACRGRRPSGCNLRGWPETEGRAGITVGGRGAHRSAIRKVRRRR